SVTRLARDAAKGWIFGPHSLNSTAGLPAAESTSARLMISSSAGDRSNWESERAMERPSAYMVLSSSVASGGGAGGCGLAAAAGLGAAGFAAAAGRAAGGFSVAACGLAVGAFVAGAWALSITGRKNNN